MQLIKDGKLIECSIHAFEVVCMLGLTKIFLTFFNFGLI